MNGLEGEKKIILHQDGVAEGEKPDEFTNAQVEIVQIERLAQDEEKREEEDLAKASNDVHIVAKRDGLNVNFSRLTNGLNVLGKKLNDAWKKFVGVEEEAIRELKKNKPERLVSASDHLHNKIYDLARGLKENLDDPVKLQQFFADSGLYSLLQLIQVGEGKNPLTAYVERVFAKVGLSVEDCLSKVRLLYDRKKFNDILNNKTGKNQVISLEERCRLLETMKDFDLFSALTRILSMLKSEGQMFEVAQKLFLKWSKEFGEKKLFGGIVCQVEIFDSELSGIVKSFRGYHSAGIGGDCAENLAGSKYLLEKIFTIFLEKSSSSSIVVETIRNYCDLDSDIYKDIFPNLMHHLEGDFLEMANNYIQCTDPKLNLDKKDEKFYRLINVIVPFGLGLSNDKWAVLQEIMNKNGCNVNWQPFIKVWKMSFQDGKVEQSKYIVDNIMAIHKLEHSHPGIIMTLYKKFGIVNFARYPENVLITQYEQRDDKHAPYGVAVYPFSDWNGAFAQSSTQELGGIHEQIKDKYLLRIIEGGTMASVVKQLIRQFKKYDQKISFGILAGHGTKDSVQFGEGQAFISEHLQSKGVKRIGNFFKPRAPLAFFSCSTGQEGGIAEQASKTWNITTSAPPIPIGGAKITVKFLPDDGLGFDHKYNTESGVLMAEKYTSQ